MENIRGGIVDVKAVGSRAVSAAGDVLATLARTAARPAPHSPLNGTVGEARRYVMIGTDLEDYRKVGDALWLRFNTGPDHSPADRRYWSLWYHGAVLDGLRARGFGRLEPILDEVADVLERLERESGLASD